MFNSQLMLISPVLFVAIIVASVVASVVAVGLVVKATIKKVASKKQDKAQSNSQPEEAIRVLVEEKNHKPKKEQKVVQTPKKQRSINDKSDLIGEAKVLKGDFEKDSFYAWVYKLKFSKEQKNSHTLAWKTTNHDSMQKALLRDLKYSFMKKFDGADSLEVKVKYQTENGVKYFEKIYTMTQEVEAQSKINKELLDVVMDIAQNNVQTAEQTLTL